MQYDLIVVGAGVGGCHLAARVARAGFRVALLDALPPKRIGNGWEVSVNRHAFNTAGIKLPPVEILEEPPEETLFYSHSPEAGVRVVRKDFHLLTIQHRRLNRYFLEFARNAGVHFMPRHRVDHPLMDYDTFTGVTGLARWAFITKSFKMTGKLTADCSGMTGILRKHAPDSFNIKREIRVQDVASAWQEVWKLDEKEAFPGDNHIPKRAGQCYTRLGKYHAFTALHLKKGGVLSMIFASSVSRDNMAYFHCRKFQAAHPELKKRLAWGGGVLPLRRSLDNLVGNGFLMAGDCACQVIPTMGSGIEASLIASDIAADTAIGALNDQDVSQRYLWRYNVEYQRKLGAVLAGYDIIRRFLQSLTPEEINKIFESGIVDERNFATTFSTAEISYNISDMADKIIRVFTRPALFPLILRFRQALSDSKKAKALYMNYPEKYEAEGFLNWRQKTDELFSNYRTF